MNPSFPIGGAERPEYTTPVQVPKKDTTLQAPAAVSQIINTEDMRKAELKGQEISISEEQVIRAIERAIKAIQGPDTRLDFSIHDTTKRIRVQVINEQSGEIIREIPQEKNLDLLAKLWEMAGILIDERR
jgi:flagellar protein FlaG